MTDEGIIEPTRGPLPEVRLRAARAKSDLEQMMGRLPSDDDYSIKLTGPCLVRKPDRSPLCVYLPGEVADLMERSFDVLASLKDERTDNRGDASGTERMKRGDQKRTRSSLISSAVIGAVDPGGIYPYCRLTSWTGTHLPEWQSLLPLLQGIDDAMRAHVRDRWTAQFDRIMQVPPEWVVPNTVFTTVTVNNSYSTGVHSDRGDLAAGFSTLAVWRDDDGHEFTGGELVFPKWRVGVDMRHGDLLLLDAHELHGNTVMRSTDGRVLSADELRAYSWRISVVAYMREKMVNCGSWPEEEAKARAYGDRRMGVTT